MDVANSISKYRRHFFPPGWQSHDPPHSDSDWLLLTAFIGLGQCDWVGKPIRVSICEYGQESQGGIKTHKKKNTQPHATL